ncbi:hypothetical protein GCM10020358_65440 [Amorphoplanes nipponensis]|uniref:GH16 domain-containing protein n=1 Tax=Actinoplanes nipponensis TaxID=135950 RepID=A0A919JM23_9ACTN|nr:glycoside hydrolase family 16 protein [Actinoplanes nipponensis]GIE51657.1 hypothetical protein Ani05nite_51910 [Actinoplanes nipponensis]
MTVAATATVIGIIIAVHLATPQHPGHPKLSSPTPAEVGVSAPAGQSARPRTSTGTPSGKPPAATTPTPAPPVARAVPEFRLFPEAVSANAVANGSAVSSPAGWSAHSDDGTVKVTRAIRLTGPFTHSTGVSLTRAGGAGSWAFSLASLRGARRFFVVGRTYRMQVWVRDGLASGQRVGVLLANGNYRHRPTDTTAYSAWRDRAWHLVTRTFVCTSRASADTAFYLALPAAGSFAFQLTDARVHEVSAPEPARITGPPVRRITFAGRSGASPDTSTWSYETGGGGWGNDEIQTYTARPQNVQTDGAGRLRIVARREQYQGTDRITRGYTSARLNTKGKVSVQPGSYVEAAITAPTGAGLWPAFWMLGTDIDSAGWPACGELDVFEGQGAAPATAHAAVHMSGLSAPDRDHGYGWDEADGTTRLDSRSHRYGVYFDDRTVRFYVDGKPTLSVWASDARASGRAWPFGKPLYLVLNVAVVKSSAASQTSFPKTMTVGPISVWAGGIPF